MQAEQEIAWIYKLCPGPPDWQLNWQENFACLDWVKPMIGCPQDRTYHAEGDVATHVQLVCQALLADESWRELEPWQRSVIFLAAIMHDVAKPECTKIDESGRISSAGHTKQGAQKVRRLLRRGESFVSSPPPLALQEMISALVRYSSLPLWLFDKEDPVYSIVACSQRIRPDWLALMCRADVLGRHSCDQNELLERIELFCQFAQEHDCLDKRYEFPSDHSRFAFFHKERRKSPCLKQDLERLVFDDTCFEVTVMSGLPGSGKDHWIEKNGGGLPVISLDSIRKQLKIDFNKDQSKVIKSAKEKAVKLMSQKQSFIWNASNISRFMRDPLIRFFSQYGARIRIVYIEAADHKTALLRNSRRAQSVPEKAWLKLADKLEVPDLTEAHELIYVCT